MANTEYDMVEHNRLMGELSKKSESDIERVVTTQFLLYMQQQGIFPCHLDLRGNPQELTGTEAINLKDDFIKSRAK